MEKHVLKMLNVRDKEMMCKIVSSFGYEVTPDIAGFSHAYGNHPCTLSWSGKTAVLLIDNSSVRLVVSSLGGDGLEIYDVSQELLDSVGAIMRFGIRL